MAVKSGPRVRRTAQNTQYTYNLSRRINTVQTYPVLSPQGATIVLYGHEDGVTVVWRGGQRFKASVYDNPPSIKSKQNGNPPDDAIMIIDSDEDDAGSTGKDAAFVDKPEFEDMADEDSEHPEITQTLDLSLGTAVLHVAVLPMTPCPAEDAGWDGVTLLTEKVVFAVSCATSELYLITLPLTPPSPASKAREDLRKTLLAAKAGNNKWGETMTLLSGQQKHSNALAMTLVKPKPASERSKSSERSQSAGRAIPRVVVAAHCGEASGTLRLWDVPLENQPKGRQVEPFQTEFLPQPLSLVSFNPTHSTQLLCNASPHAVRIYDYATPSMPSDEISEGPFPSQGSWLISLYPPFARPSSSRKPVLAASWIAHGRAILALLADGQWGIWDIDGVSPQGPALFGKQGSGIRGGALTSFSVSGFIEGTSMLRNPGTHRTSGTGAEFVPMTPHTRRDALSASTGPERLAAMRGGITVTALPARATTTADESAVLWIGGSEHVTVIPGLLKFWEAQLRKGTGGGVNLFSGAQPTRMIRLSDLAVGLMGERCIGVGAMCRFGGGDDPANEGLPIEVLVCGESRLVVVHESQTVVGTRIGGIMGRRKKLSERARDSSAIIAYPRPDQPASQLYNLSINPRRKLNETPLASDNLADKILPSTEVEDAPVEQTPPPPQPNTGFSFADKLAAAADEMQDDEDESRDVEVEMLDIMEIDRELEAMDSGRGRGRKKVLFES
ncbi:uncharacterized protein BCR38DRAFT_47904 [Pseudomassariella vexata]|uniref:WD40-repeat-containing domain protein n=1 Tax=Pseudomassariella vexata TaxID=1141098 RepID=A0A1Y2DNI3_9PEZI|nr:uncharacterized protein BCR38DRAFT_47904 [Pseudomassariella vexata]ORY60848.1 hypothetical protein BCR38DRAFT_47904 [Pseudomassariella vexata]